MENNLRKIHIFIQDPLALITQRKGVGLPKLPVTLLSTYYSPALFHI